MSALSEVIAVIEAQQPKERSAVWMVGEQLKDICRADPSAADGYGNERHGPNKEYKHSIPQPVRDFCDRWQREVLLPWFASRNEKGTLSAIPKKKAGAA